MRIGFLPASCVVALLLAAPPLAQAQSMLKLGSGGPASPVGGGAVGLRGSKDPAAARPARGRVEPAVPPPPTARPWIWSRPTRCSTRSTAATSRTARDAISRGADLQGHNILGMTPLELSVDLGRNDISFMLLSMRAADDGRSRQAPAAPDDGEAARDEAGETGAARIRRRGSPHRRRPPRRRRGSTAATAARRTRMPGFLGFDSGRR